MTDYTPSSPNPNGWTNRQYGHTDAAAPHKVTRCNGILPDPERWPKPPGGYPYVIWLGFQGYSQTSLLFSIDEGVHVPQHALLEQGIAIVSASLPVARDPLTTGIPVAQADGAFNLGSGQLGLQYRGNGHITRWGQGPSSSPPYPGELPTGYAAAHPGRPHPMIDPDWFCAEKSAQDIIRHCREHAEDLGLDSTRDGIYGNSAGAHAALTAAQGDKALVAENISSGGQQAQSTRVKVIAVQHPNASSLMMRKKLSSGGPAAWRAARDDGSGDHDVGCAEWADDAANSVVLSISPTWWLGQHADWPGMKAANDSQRIWVSSNSPMHADVLADPNRYTSTFGHIGTNTTGETNPHSFYSAYRLMEHLPAGRYVATNQSHVDPNAVAAGALRQVDAVIEDQDELFADMVEYIVQTIGSPPTAEEQVVDALVETLASVSLANGFQTDVQRVYRWEDIPSAMNYAPFISFRTDTTRRDTKSFTGQTEKFLRVVLLLVIKGWQGHETRLARFEADVEQALAQDCTLGGKAFNVTPGNSERELGNPKKVQSAYALFDIEVQFRHLRTDPYALVLQSS